MISPAYRDQVDLLIRLLPEIAAESTFALKGGTAINLFVCEMPRISVDIDLTYLPLNDRTVALQEISDALRRIESRIGKVIPDASTQTVVRRGGQEAKLICRSGNAMVKLEVNTVIRGHLWPTRKLELTQAAQDQFGKTASIAVVSQAELYGGKLCAALDRQHPRDLFDVQQLLDNEGLSENVRLGFLTCLLSHTRPMHELLRPRLQDRRTRFREQFEGMAVEPFSYEQFQEAQDRLVREVHSMLQDNDRALLISVKRGKPDWSLFPVPGLETLPAVRWKLSNIEKLKENARKHAEQLDALEKVLIN